MPLWNAALPEWCWGDFTYDSAWYICWGLSKWVLRWLNHKNDVHNSAAITFIEGVNSGLSVWCSWNEWNGHQMNAMMHWYLDSVCVMMTIGLILSIEVHCDLISQYQFMTWCQLFPHRWSAISSLSNNIIVCYLPNMCLGSEESSYNALFFYFYSFFF